MYIFKRLQTGYKRVHLTNADGIKHEEVTDSTSVIFKQKESILDYH